LKYYSSMGDGFNADPRWAWNAPLRDIALSKPARRAAKRRQTA
jgi:hypothetical protein